VWREIVTDGAPRPGGPYSQAIAAGDTLYSSGQLGFDPQTGGLPEEMYAETERLLVNLDAVLRAGGLARGDVVKTTVFISNLDDYQAMDDAYRAFFGEPFPTRSTVMVAGLLRGARVEIEAVAARRPS